MQVKQSRFIIVLLGIIAVGVVVVIVNALIWNHLHSDTARYMDEYNQINAELLSNKRAINNLPHDQQKLRELEAELAVLDKNLADYSYVPSYLEQIKVTTERTHNIVIGIAPGVPKPLDLSKGPFAEAGGDSPDAKNANAPADNAEKKENPWSKYQVLGINLDVKGDYVSIIQLLDEFRRFPKMIYVRNVDLSPQNVNGKNIVSAKISTYAIITPDQYQSLAEKKASAAAGGPK